MRWIILILFLAATGLIGYGLYIQSADEKSGDFYTGLGVVGFFFVFMPLFLYHRRKKIKVEKYMLTKENLRRMRDHNKGK